MTREEAISDIELRITRAKPSDDLQINHDLIAHWIDTVRDTIVSDRLDRMVRKGEEIPSVYIMKLQCSVIKIEDLDCNDEDCDDRYYLELIDSLGNKYYPFDIFKDKAIVRITTSGGELVTRANEVEIDTIKHLYWSKPGRKNLMWYREDGEIFINGLSNRLAKGMTFNVYFAPKQIMEHLSDTDEIPLESTLSEILLEGVWEVAMKTLGGPFEDLLNDATQE